MNAKLAIETLLQETGSENRIQETLEVISDDRDVIPLEIVIHARAQAIDPLRESVTPLFVP